MKKITKTLVTQTINKIKFDPRKPGPLKVILESGDETYYVNRAKEFLAGGNLTDAIRLLTIALILRDARRDDSREESLTGSAEA